jgi:hypothetical protein
LRGSLVDELRIGCEETKATTKSRSYQTTYTSLEEHIPVWFDGDDSICLGILRDGGNAVTCHHIIIDVRAMPSVMKHSEGEVPRKGLFSDVGRKTPLLLLTCQTAGH